MIINIGKKLEGFNRYNGGWIKTITRLDKDYKNGYSLVGEFLPVSSGNIDLEEDVLYLDCSIGGSRKNQEKDYHLFKLIDGEIFTIQTVEDGGPDWAMTLWESVEKELGTTEDKVQKAVKTFKNLSDEEFFHCFEELRKTDRRYQTFTYLLLEDFLKTSLREGTLKQTIDELEKEI